MGETIQEKIQEILQRVCIKYQFDIYEYSKIRDIENISLPHSLFWRELYESLDELGVDGLAGLTGRPYYPITVHTDLFKATFGGEVGYDMTRWKWIRVQIWPISTNTNIYI